MIDQVLGFYLLGAILIGAGLFGLFVAPNSAQPYEIVAGAFVCAVARYTYNQRRNRAGK
jgi:hypothetical protein